MKKSIKLKATSITFGVIMWIIYAVLLVYALTIILSLGWAAVSSLKDIGDYVLHPFALPKKAYFSNYLTAINALTVESFINGEKHTVYIEMLAFNSIAYSVGSAFVSTASVVCTAYAVAKYPKFFSSKILYGVAVIFMVVPLGASDIGSTFKLYDLFNIRNNFLGIMFTKAGFVGFNFILFHSAFTGLGKEYCEAASIDGANCVQIYFSITLPMVMNLIAIVFVTSFVGNWNDWTTSYLFLTNMPTISYALYLLQFKTGTAESLEPVRMAASILVCIPGLVMFFLFRKPMMNSALSVSGIKG